MKTSSLTLLRFALLLLIACAAWVVPLEAQDFPGAVVFFEPEFPSADSANASQEQLSSMLPGARFASAEALVAELDSATTRLLVMPFGSAFPEQDWPAIYSFLQRGGNLLVLGGKPFTRAAYRDRSAWKLREYSVRFARQLLIDQYQDTPGSDGLEFQTNPEVTFHPSHFTWKRAFSPVIRLSAVDLYPRGGSAGSLDARLDTLAWGTKDGRRLAAPLIEIDHQQNGFDGGRWIFLSADLSSDIFSALDRSKLVSDLAARAMRGSASFTVRPTLPLYLVGEPVELDVEWQAATPAPASATVKVTIFPEGQPSRATSKTVALTGLQTLSLAAPTTQGFHIVEAKVLDGDKTLVIYHSGFWIRDEAYLRSGPRFTANQDYLELDGHPLAVAGTTYMSSDVQRLYFEHPNVYVWDRDLAQIHSAGLNMLRAGWWTGWDKFCDENGQPYERTLRTVEAYLMTARKYNLPVQFNFFAFLPEVLGGVNPYLDPQAVRKQQTLVAAVVARFRDVPFLAWDLINEPSFSKHLWTLLPNEDAVELARWNEWLTKRYPDRAALAADWNVLPASVQGTIALPQAVEFTSRGMYIGHNSLKVYDFSLFSQECFAQWVAGMREKIRATGSQQLITVGQDEGGFVNRLSPAFFGESVDFTTNHSWWQNDFILWDSLVAKQPGKAMLIQETGLQRELNLDEVARRDQQNEAALFERKFAASFVQGSGAIEWLWNTNSYMTEGNETPIGAVRTDGTEKPEATVMRDFGTFAAALGPHLRNPVPPSVAIVTSQAAQFSAIADLQIAAQRNAVRALAYGARLAPYVIAENQIDKLGSPKLVILPSPQAITEKAWQALLKYVDGGGNLLITGPLDRDEHWQVVARQEAIIPDARTEPLTFHQTTLLDRKNKGFFLNFDQEKQNWLDTLRFKDGTSLREIPRGTGQIFWCAYPVELSEEMAAATGLYNYVASSVGLEPNFDLLTPLSTGVLVYSTVLDDAVLYVLVSDDSGADVAQVDLRDKPSGGHLRVLLEGEHAAVVLLDKKSGAVLAKYDSPIKQFYSVR
jgi:hypothetical protein